MFSGRGLRFKLSGYRFSNNPFFKNNKTKRWRKGNVSNRLQSLEVTIMSSLLKLMSKPADVMFSTIQFKLLSIIFLKMVPVQFHEY